MADILPLTITVLFLTSEEKVLFGFPFHITSLVWKEVRIKLE
jgi:hypothetical protein